DFRGTGKLDLICGEFRDGFTFYENIGTRTAPVYAAGRALVSAGVPVIYVNIASHSEDGTTPGYPDFSTDKASFDTERAGVVAFANMIAQHQAKYDYQSDWNFLLGVQKYDAGDASTNGKNVLRYLSEDLGFAVDPHSHEKNGYNYADVAYLIKANGVEPSHVVGGFIASPADQSKLSYLSTLTHGSKYPTYEWKPEILWGGGTGNHVNESALWISGIWHPKSASSYAVDDPSAPLPVVGHYESGWNGLDQLLALQGEGKLTEGNIYTVTIMSDQPDFTDSYVSAFSAKLDEYADETAAGKIVWATIEETYDAWVDSYGSKASILPWSGTTTADSGPSAHSSTGGSSSGSSLPPKGGSSGSASGGSLLDPSVKANCGNGTCDKLEKTSGLCPTDCS
ncbi:hypothetical protein EBS80_04855, partial [bacterium]|nr:hypothetical protein [bacterium]